MRIIYLPVNDATKKIDYVYVEYDLTEEPREDDPDSFRLIPGWAWKPFKVIPVDF